MYYVYLLKNKNGQYYIGYTVDLRRRIKEHFVGKVATTKRLSVEKLLYYEAYANEAAAKERESKLKQFGSSYHGLIKRLRL
ncbi:MAG: GIY-YIG nuclease family protein [bacterium]|nr:GIY-YIG nuclease family protein [bacterium]